MRVAILMAGVGMALALSACGSVEKSAASGGLGGAAAGAMVGGPVGAVVGAGIGAAAGTGAEVATRDGGSGSGASSHNTGTSNTASRNTLRDAQTNLAQGGYYKGPIDGLNGPKTRAALRAYQRDYGLKQTAKLDAATHSSLSQQSAAVPKSRRIN